MILRSRKTSSAGALPCAAVACALLLSLPTAFAANLEFLHDTPLSYMTQKDIDSVKRAAITALNSKSDGESAHWTNEGLGNGVKIDATLTPHDTTKTGDRTCRVVDVVLNAKGQSLNLHPRYCRTGRAQWQLQKKN
ncbi:hypothetical protein LMG27952_05253 [Paraburkholderia hiiakae]|uniref:Outer membrane surface antigen n=1 Tax=Paraburkholderia hiiakae TaxID=1081782 RepID=A0ABN7I440_9BURK|nr:hypothetical protein [Paraburkholderia hiiakae]CAD6552203.1 hypothetical protein LMG27952_05253 [Paraburkholderia hiiakae]